MNGFFASRRWSYLFIVVCIPLYGQDKSSSFSSKFPNYYELIGLDYETVHKEAFDLVEQDNDFKQAREAEIEARKTPGKEAEVKQLQDKKEKIRTTLENKFFAEKIKPACEQARRKYQEQLQEAQKKVEEVEEFEREAAYRKLNDLQIRIRLTTTACPVLLNPKKRQTYDTQLVRGAIETDATYFQGIQRGVEEAMLYAPDKKVLVNEIIGDLLSQVEIPGPALQVFNQNLAIRSLNFLPRPFGPDVQYGLGFSGLMAFNRFEVRLSIYVIQDIYGMFKFSFIMDLPQAYKISDLFPSFRGFDAFKFPQAKLIIANFEGMDNDGFSFKKGFNFGALLDLSGPLQILSDLKDKTTSLKSLVFESKPIVMNGVIPLDISKAEFSAKVPLYIGVDLRQISAIPTTISRIINKITTDDFTLLIAPVAAKKAIGEEGKRELTEGEKPKKEQELVKPYIEILKAETEESSFKIHGSLTGKVSTLATIPIGFRIQAETGIRITLGTQPNPIRLNAMGLIIPVSKNHPHGLLSVGGSMKEMLQLDWLALGNAAIDFDFDGALMPAAAALGIPFTGIGIRGQLDLGKAGDARATLKVAGGFRVAVSLIPVDVIFEISGDNIRFADLVSYSTKLATQAKLMKAPIAVERIPTMTLHKIWGYCAVKDTTIGGKTYNAGLGLQVETEVFDHKAGFRIFMTDKFKLSGWGYLPPIDFKVKKTEVFRLYGTALDKGARLSFNFDPVDPLKGRFGLQGTVHLPTLGLKQKTDLTWHGYVIDTDFETEFPGFSVLFGLRMNLKAGVERLSPYDQMKNEVETLLEKADMQSTTAQAAKKLFDQAVTLEYEKRHKEAVNLLAQAKTLLEGAPSQRAAPSKSAKKEAPGVTLSKDVATRVKELEGRITALKIDIDALFMNANSMQKQETSYKQAEEKIRQATNQYEQYQSSQTKEQWDTLYNATFNNLLEKARVRPPVTDQDKQLAVAGAERAVNMQKVTMLENILKLLTEAHQDLAALLGQTGKTKRDDYLTTREEVETEPGAKWNKLYIKFGFKGDFGAFLSKQAAPTLRKVKENAGKKLDQLNERVALLQAQAVGSVEQEINATKEAIAAKTKEISELQAKCRVLPLYKQINCRASIAGHSAILASKKAYLQALLTPGKAVVKKVTQAAATVSKQLAQGKALRAATEAVLEAAATGLEMIGLGLSFLNITEARGEYSWDDMQSLKLPRLVRLVANIEIPNMPLRIVLRDLQFDFKHPGQSATEITRAIMIAFIENQQSKYLKYIP